MLRTPRLELRLPDPGRLAELAGLAAAGVHDPAVQPFVGEWTDVPPEQRARSVLQWNWRLWARWRPELWSHGLVAIADFAVLREVGTGSWEKSAASR